MLREFSRKRLGSALVCGLIVLAGLLLPASTVAAAFGIEPGKVTIDNLSPGTQGEFTITLVNQDEDQTVYSVAARQPDYTQAGYEALPYLNWVTVSPTSLTVAGRGKGTVDVIVAMPAGADYAGKKAEFWVGFKEEGAPGMVKIEIASRVFVNTRAADGGATPGVTSDGAVGISANPTAAGTPPWAWGIVAVLAVAVATGLVIRFVSNRKKA